MKRNVVCATAVGTAIGLLAVCALLWPESVRTLSVGESSVVLGADPGPCTERFVIYYCSDKHMSCEHKEQGNCSGGCTACTTASVESWCFTDGTLDVQNCTNGSLQNSLCGNYYVNSGENTVHCEWNGAKCECVGGVLGTSPCAKRTTSGAIGGCSIMP